MVSPTPSSQQKDVGRPTTERWEVGGDPASKKWIALGIVDTRAHNSHTNTHAHTHTHTQTHTHTHTHTHTRTHARTHTHTHTHIHTHTRTCISVHKAHTSCQFTAQKASPTFQHRLRCFPLLVFFFLLIQEAPEKKVLDVNPIFWFGGP